MKRAIALILALTLVLAVFLTGCSSNETPASEEETSISTAGEEPKLKVGLVLAGGLGDRSFYDSANEGVEKAKET